VFPRASVMNTRNQTDCSIAHHMVSVKMRYFREVIISFLNYLGTNCREITEALVSETGTTIVSDSVN